MWTEKREFSQFSATIHFTLSLHNEPNNIAPINSNDWALQSNYSLVSTNLFNTPSLEGNNFIFKKEKKDIENNYGHIFEIILYLAQSLIGTINLGLARTFGNCKHWSTKLGC